MKNFKLFILFIITAAFLVPGVIRAVSCPPKPPVASNVVINGNKVSFKLCTASDNKIPIGGYRINWGDGNLTDYCAGCSSADKVQCLPESESNHTYNSSGPFTITAWFTRFISGSLIKEDCKDIITVTTWGGSGDNGGDDDDKSPTVLSLDPTINEKTVEITVTGRDDKQLELLAVAWGDDKDSYCFCDGGVEPCDNQGDTTCSHTFTHTYSEDKSYKIGAWATDVASQHSKIDKYPISIGDSSGGDNGEGIHTPIGTVEITNPLTATDFKDFIDKIVSFLFTISLLIVPILLVAAGIMFLTAQGDPTKVGTAKKMVLYTLIGFAIISLARVFVKLIYQVFLE